jgi:parvulin-like peptidyl-prolyl isomerase
MLEGIILAKKKHSHHAHKGHGTHKRKARKKAPQLGNYAFGIVVFVVLVAVVVAIIMLATRSGESRLLSQKKTAAIVNGEKISMDYIDDQYERVPETYKSVITKETLVNQSINEALLLQEAKKKGIDVTESDVEDEIEAALDAANMTAADLDERLKAQNLTRSELEELYRKQLIINELLENTVFDKIVVSSDDVEQFYDSRIRAMHILVDTEDEAEDIIAELKRSTLRSIEDDFADLAEEKSIDPSAETNSGDLGEFSKGMMVPEFEQAAFALDEYAFTAEPVQTQFGYHVILRVPKEQTLNEQYSAIEELLESQKKAQAVPLYVSQLVNNADIQVLYKEEAKSEE